MNSKRVDIAFGRRDTRRQAGTDERTHTHAHALPPYKARLNFH